MRFSANLNIMIKAAEKAVAYVSRDFTELANLQNSPATADKFAVASYNKIKRILIDDLWNLRPDYDITFSDGQKLSRDGEAEYSYKIIPIDGMDNFMRSGSDFTIAIALEHLNKNGQMEAISIVIKKIIGGETYYCEKGFGAYCNDRRIRVSKRPTSETRLCAVQNINQDVKEFLDEQKIVNISPRFYGCNTLEIAYLSSARLELAIFGNSDNHFLEPFLLLAREAGGIVKKSKNLTLVTNN